ncbi:MAG: glycosyltransferase family 4 protein, partial [Acidobacteria bacterium]|nr:glycosyltransferase family 4 protein [Acidobacteriota bacterium]
MTSSKTNARRIRVGIVANEFFHHELGGMGGFGWAARQAARLFEKHPEHGFEAVFLNRTLPPAGDGGHTRAHDTPLVTRSGGRLSGLGSVRAARPDLLLMIDYRPGYRFFAGVLPRTPIIVWVRDPRPPEEVRRVHTLRIPGAEGARPQGIAPIDCTSLGKIVRASRLLARPVLFAATTPCLAAKVRDTYDVTPPEVFSLPNPVEPRPGEVVKSERPRVVFLGRLDPIKRPWLFAELAARFPRVEFLFMGRNHFKGEGAWKPEGLPPNVRLLGHLDGEEKVRTISSAWALVNTSIAESLAVSFLEAFSCETPVVSCVNTEDVVSRFGAYVGRFDGDGRDSLQRFAEALDRLLRDAETRTRLGREGRAWVEA